MKLEDTVLPVNMRAPGLLSWMAGVKTIFNESRYQCRIISSVPTWTTHEGEFVFYSDGAGTRRMYAYIDAQWVYATWYPGHTEISGQHWWIHDTDEDTYITTEGTDGTGDADLIEMYVADTKIVTADVDQFAVESGIKLGLEGDDGDTYWKYNSGTEYMEGWVDGVKRMEM